MESLVTLLLNQPAHKGVAMSGCILLIVWAILFTRARYIEYRIAREQVRTVIFAAHPRNFGLSIWKDPEEVLRTFVVAQRMRKARVSYAILRLAVKHEVVSFVKRDTALMLFAESFFKDIDSFVGLLCKMIIPKRTRGHVTQNLKSLVAPIV